MNTEEFYINNEGPYPGFVDFETEIIQTPSLGGAYKPDTNWFHIDENGHFHSFDKNENDNRLPTLKASVALDEYNPVRYSCLLCAEVVVPNYVAKRSSHLESVPGKTTYYLTVEGYISYKALQGDISFYSDKHFGIGYAPIHSVNDAIGRRATVRSVFVCKFLAVRNSE